MIAERIKQLRLARGWSMDELSRQLGGIVTKQALSKYELGKSKPTPTVSARLAEAFGVKTSFLFQKPQFRIEFIAYRKRSKLAKKEQAQVENTVRHLLEKRLSLQQMISPDARCDVPIRSFYPKHLDEIERFAGEVRDQWKLGRAPIADMIGVLEDHCVHVLELKTAKEMDGLSAIAFRTPKKAAAAAVVTNSDIPGERMRFNLAHELGHLVLDVTEQIDPEKAAHRFAAAFLAPAEELIREVGNKRTHLTPQELLILKKQFRLSVQALIYRLRDLQIISESLYKEWWIRISKMGWKQHEPEELRPEKPHWLQQNLLRAIAEGFIAPNEADHWLKGSQESETPNALSKRQAFMNLPLEERRRLLAEQAQKFAAYYEENNDLKDLQGGDFFEGESTQSKTK